MLALRQYRESRVDARCPQQELSLAQALADERADGQSRVQEIAHEDVILDVHGAQCGDPLEDGRHPGCEEQADEDHARSCGARRLWSGVRKLESQQVVGPGNPWRQTGMSHELERLLDLERVDDVGSQAVTIHR